LADLEDLAEQLSKSRHSQPLHSHPPLGQAGKIKNPQPLKRNPYSRHLNLRHRKRKKQARKRTQTMSLKMRDPKMQMMAKNLVKRM